MQAGCPTLTSPSGPLMFRDNVMGMTYVLESHTHTHTVCCPALSTGARSALLWHPASSMSLGMLHYLHRAFLWPRWDMTGATGSSWIKQRLLKAHGEGTGWWGGLGVGARRGSTAPGMQIATHMSPLPRGWRDLRQGRKHGGTEKEQKRWPDREGWGGYLVKAERKGYKQTEILSAATLEHERKSRSKFSERYVNPPPDAHKKNEDDVIHSADAQRSAWCLLERLHKRVEQWEASGVVLREAQMDRTTAPVRCCDSSPDAAEQTDAINQTLAQVLLAFWQMGTKITDTF